MEEKKPTPEKKETLIEKASRSLQLVVVGNINGKEIPPATNYKGFAGLYDENVWIHSCIRAIADAAMGLPVKIYYRASDGESGKEEIKKAEDVGKAIRAQSPNEKKQWIEVDDDFPGVQLFENPNPDMTWPDLIDATMIYLEVDGNEFWEIARMGNRPAELYPMRPDRITIVPRSDGKGIKQYIFKLNRKATEIVFESDDVLFFKYFDPLNDFRGIGPISSVTESVLVYQYITQYNKNFFKNDGTPSGYLYTDRPMDEKDAGRVATQWGKRHSGVKNAHKTAVLPFGLKYEQLGVSPNDGQFSDLYKNVREEILSAFSVPPVRVGLLEHAKYDNYKLQEFAFYRATMRPKMMKVASVLTKFINKEYGELTGKKYWVEFDFDEYLGEDIADKINRYSKLFGIGGVTSNQIVEEFGMGEPFEGGEVHFVAPGYLPLETEARASLAEMEAQVRDAQSKWEEAYAERMPEKEHRDDDEEEEEEAPKPKPKKKLERRATKSDDEFEIQKPYPNEHACRLAPPDDFEDGSFRRTKRKSKNGKIYSVIMGKKKGSDSMSEQAYRYSKSTWDVKTARSHCKTHDGSFEASVPAKKDE